MPKQVEAWMFQEPGCLHSPQRVGLNKETSVSETGVLRCLRLASFVVSSPGRSAHSDTLGATLFLISVTFSLMFVLYSNPFHNHHLQTLKFLPPGSLSKMVSGQDHNIVNFLATNGPHVYVLFTRVISNSKCLSWY